MLTRQEEIAEILNSGKEIEFRSFTGFTQMSLQLEPTPDGLGWYKGVARLTRDLRESGNPFVDPSDSDNAYSKTTIKHGTRFDTSQEAHRLILQWLLQNETFIALSFDEGKKMPEAKFYVYDKDIAAKRELDRFNRKLEAMQKVATMSNEDLAKIMRILGMRTENQSSSDIRTFMQNYVQTDYNKFLDSLKDSLKEEKDFALSLLDKGIIKKTKTGEHKFNEHSLAPSFEGFLRWIVEAQKAKKGDDYQLLLQLKELLDTK